MWAQIPSIAIPAASRSVRYFWLILSLKKDAGLWLCGLEKWEVPGHWRVCPPSLSLSSMPITPFVANEWFPQVIFFTILLTTLLSFSTLLPYHSSHPLTNVLKTKHYETISSRKHFC